MDDRSQDDRTGLAGGDDEALGNPEAGTGLPLLAGLGQQGTGLGAAVGVGGNPDDDDPSPRRGRPSGTSDEPVQNG